MFRRTLPGGMDIDETVTRLLRAVDEDEFDPSTLGLEFEAGADRSFDAVLRHLDEPETSDAGRVRALQTLARLASQFCVPRKAELIELCMRLMELAPLPVRSAAVNTAIFTLSSLRLLKRLRPEELAALERRLKEAVSKALRDGIAPEMLQLASRFVAADESGFELPDE